MKKSGSNEPPVQIDATVKITGTNKQDLRGIPRAEFRKKVSLNSSLCPGQCEF